MPPEPFFNRCLLGVDGQNHKGSSCPGHEVLSKPMPEQARNRQGTAASQSALFLTRERRESFMKGMIAYFLGIPIVVIILLYITGVF